MKRWWLRKISPALLFALLVLPLHADLYPPIGMQGGQMFPDFRLPSLDGGYTRLSDFRGQKVLLIHFASW